MKEQSRKRERHRQRGKVRQRKVTQRERNREKETHRHPEREGKFDGGRTDNYGQCCHFHVLIGLCHPDMPDPRRAAAEPPLPRLSWADGE